MYLKNSFCLSSYNQAAFYSFSVGNNFYLWIYCLKISVQLWNTFIVLRLKFIFLYRIKKFLATFFDTVITVRVTSNAFFASNFTSTYSSC